MALNKGAQSRGLSRLRGERLPAVIAAAVVLELFAGFTTLVALGRTSVPYSGAPVIAWQAPGKGTGRPLPPPAPSPASSAETPVVEVTADQVPAPSPSTAAPRPAAQARPAPPAASRYGTASAQSGDRAAPPSAPPPAPAPDPHMPATGDQNRRDETDSERIFREQFPVQAAARQNPQDRSTAHWAVLVGVNAYQGRTKHTIGSVADAVLLRQLLLQRGWRDDHILMLTDANATRDNIVRSLEWLARNTDDTSVVIFSFSGHMKYQRGDPDRDGEAYDSGLWATDNAKLWDSDFARMVDAIRSERMWLAMQGCHAQGMNDGLDKPGRVITYSSLEREKSYEDPDVNHSVQGWFMYAEGIRDRWADANHDGVITVQEAYHWGAPRAHRRTAYKQSPQLYDGLGRPFALEVS